MCNAIADIELGQRPERLLLRSRVSSLRSGLSCPVLPCLSEINDLSGKAFNVRYWHLADIPSLHFTFGGKADDGGCRSSFQGRSACLRSMPLVGRSSQIWKINVTVLFKGVQLTF